MPSLPELTFPKHIRISNPRLNMVFYLMMVTFFSVIVSIFFQNRSFMQKVQVSTLLSVHRDVVQDNAESALWNQTLNPACASGLCVPPSAMLDAFFHEESGTQMFVVTAFRIVPALGLRLHEPDEQHFLVPSFDSFGLMFSFVVDIDVPPADFLSHIFPPLERRIRSTDTVTLVLDGEGRPWRQVPAGERITLSVSEALHLAEGSLGQRGSSDRAVRDLGTELSARADCYDVDNDWRAELQVGLATDGLPVASSQNPVCLLRFDLSASVANSKQVLPASDGSKGLGSFVTSVGLRVRCDRGGGSFTAFSVQNIYMTLTSLIVWLAVPRTLLLWFTVRALGHMSRIYKQAIVEPFEIRTEVAGLAARLIVQSLAFVELADVASTAWAGDAHGGLSKDALAERLHHILHNRGALLGQDERDHLVTFVYEQLTGSDSRGTLRDILREMAADGNTLRKLAKREKDILYESFQSRGKSGGEVSPALSSTTQESRESRAPSVMDGTRLIDIDAFSVMCSSSERLHFTDWLRLFDRTRKQSFLEKFFLPHVLMRHLTHANKTSFRFGTHRRFETQMGAVAVLEVTAEHTSGSHVCGDSSPRAIEMTPTGPRPTELRATTPPPKFISKSFTARKIWMEEQLLKVDELSSAHSAHHQQLAGQQMAADEALAAAAEVRASLEKAISTHNQRLEERFQECLEAAREVVQTHLLSVEEQLISLRVEVRKTREGSRSCGDADAPTRKARTSREDCLGDQMPADLVEDLRALSARVAALEHRFGQSLQALDIRPFASSAQSLALSSPVTMACSSESQAPSFWQPLFSNAALEPVSLSGPLLAPVPQPRRRSSGGGDDSRLRTLKLLHL